MMQSPIEECTYNELKERLKARLVTDLFAGTLDAFIGAAIDLSIRWWKVEEERRNIESKYYVPDGARIAESDMSIRAIRVLTTENFITAKDIRGYISAFDYPYQARAAIRKFVGT